MSKKKGDAKMEQNEEVKTEATAPEPKKKRVRRTAAEMLKQREADVKRLKAKAKAEEAAQKLIIRTKCGFVIEKQLGRELKPEDLERLATFLKDQDDRGGLFRAAMERDF